MYTFRKSERLCNRVTIGKLYSSPKRELVFPLSAHWMYTDPQQDKKAAKVQVIITAPKKKLHHAVDRNHAKRIIRECYRLRKHRLYEALAGKTSDTSQTPTMAISINYIYDKIADFHRIEAAMDKLIDKLTEDIAHD